MSPLFKCVVTATQIRGCWCGKLESPNYRCRYFTIKNAKTIQRGLYIVWAMHSSRIKWCIWGAFKLLKLSLISPWSEFSVIFIMGLHPKKFMKLRQVDVLFRMNSLFTRRSRRFNIEKRFIIVWRHIHIMMTVRDNTKVEIKKKKNLSKISTFFYCNLAIFKWKIFVLVFTNSTT